MFGIRFGLVQFCHLRQLIGCVVVSGSCDGGGGGGDGGADQPTSLRVLGCSEAAGATTSTSTSYPLTIHYQTAAAAAGSFSKCW